MDKTDAKTIKTTASVFELPQKLGIIQHIEYMPEKQCTFGRCFYEGVLTAEGCRRGICIQYRVQVRSKDKKQWEAKEKWRGRSEEVGGCLRQPVADALWELSERFEVGLWYEYRHRCTTFKYLCADSDLTMEDCGIMINGIRLKLPYCRTADDCVERILEDYQYAVERLKEPPMKTDDASELLREWPELEAFGVEWVKKWMPYAKERMVRIAEVLRSYNRARMIIEKVSETRENPYVIEVFIAPDGEVCIAISADVYCLSTDDKVRKMPLDYIGQVPPRGLMAFVKRKEFVRII